MANGRVMGASPLSSYGLQAHQVKDNQASRVPKESAACRGKQRAASQVRALDATCEATGTTTERGV